jgi:hypothetical protein
MSEKQYCQFCGKEKLVFEGKYYNEDTGKKNLYYRCEDNCLHGIHAHKETGNERVPPWWCRMFGSPTRYEMKCLYCNDTYWRMPHGWYD